MVCRVHVVFIFSSGICAYVEGKQIWKNNAVDYFCSWNYFFIPSIITNQKTVRFTKKIKKQIVSKLCFMAILYEMDSSDIGIVLIDAREK